MLPHRIPTHSHSPSTLAKVMPTDHPTGDLPPPALSRRAIVTRVVAGVAVAALVIWGIVALLDRSSGAQPDSDGAARIIATS